MTTLSSLNALDHVRSACPGISLRVAAGVSETLQVTFRVYRRIFGPHVTDDEVLEFVWTNCFARQLRQMQ